MRQGKAPVPIFFIIFHTIAHKTCAGIFDRLKTKGVPDYAVFMPFCFKGVHTDVSLWYNTAIGFLALIIRRKGERVYAKTL